MKLIEHMREAVALEKSMFAAQLLKEDIRRLKQVQQFANSSADFAGYRKKAMLLGWTSGDLRTFELNPELGAFLEAAYHATTQAENRRLLSELYSAWDALNRKRMDVLVGCLSRPRIN